MMKGRHVTLRDLLDTELLDGPGLSYLF